MIVPVHTVRYRIGHEVVAEVETAGILHHLPTEAVVDGLLCNCSGQILPSEPGVIVIDCVPFQVSGDD